MTNFGRNWKNQFRGDFKIVDPEPTHSYHGGGFAQDFVDADGRLIHATWRGDVWNLEDANTGEFLGIHAERQLPDPNTFRPNEGASAADIHHNDQLISKLRAFLRRTS